MSGDVTRDWEIRTSDGWEPIDHLERALECSDRQLKNFHIRQAMQLLIADSTGA